MSAAGRAVARPKVACLAPVLADMPGEGAEGLSTLKWLQLLLARRPQHTSRGPELSGCCNRAAHQDSHLENGAALEGSADAIAPTEGRAGCEGMVPLAICQRYYTSGG
jgi:hypothetical protein